MFTHEFLQQYADDVTPQMRNQLDALHTTFVPYALLLALKALVACGEAVDVPYPTEAELEAERQAAIQEDEDYAKTIRIEGLY